MPPSLDDLEAFLAEKRDSREYRRGIAVKMAIKGYLYTLICDALNVSPGFISQWKSAYEAHGVAGLTLHYQGSQAYLAADERAAVLAWIRAQESWSVDQLKTYLETTYDVVFQSRQSYYELFDAAGITWKKAQRSNPAKDPEVVAEKKGDHRTSDRVARRDRNRRTDRHIR
jgi:putative transposase